MLFRPIHNSFFKILSRFQKDTLKSFGREETSPMKGRRWSGAFLNSVDREFTHAWFASVWQDAAKLPWTGMKKLFLAILRTDFVLEILY